jgi:hypothetical protein
MPVAGAARALYAGVEHFPSVGSAETDSSQPGPLEISCLYRVSIPIVLRFVRPNSFTQINGAVEGFATTTRKGNPSVQQTGSDANYDKRWGDR